MGRPTPDLLLARPAPLASSAPAGATTLRGPSTRRLLRSQGAAVPAPLLGPRPLPPGAPLRVHPREWTDGEWTGRPAGPGPPSLPPLCGGEGDGRWAETPLGRAPRAWTEAGTLGPRRGRRRGSGSSAAEARRSGPRRWTGLGRPPYSVRQGSRGTSDAGRSATTGVGGASRAFGG